MYLAVTDISLLRYPILEYGPFPQPYARGNTQTSFAIHAAVKRKSHAFQAPHWWGAAKVAFVSDGLTFVGIGIFAVEYFSVHILRQDLRVFSGLGLLLARKVLFEKVLTFEFVLDLYASLEGLFLVWFGVVIVDIAVRRDVLLVVVVLGSDAFSASWWHAIYVSEIFVWNINVNILF